MPLHWQRHARTPRLALIVLAVYAGLAALWLGFQAAPWVIALLALPTLPALHDLWRNPVVRFDLDEETLSWSARGRSTTLALPRIRRARFDTRWDFSIRVTLFLNDGQSLRLPPDVTPPDRSLDAALTARGIPVERQHFRFF